MSGGTNSFRQPAEPGRHRRVASGETWTPAVPAQGRRTQHGTEQPIDPAVSGSLPLISQIMDPRREQQMPAYLASRGLLPVPPPEPRRTGPRTTHRPRPPVPVSAAEQSTVEIPWVPQRTRVTLTPPSKPRHERTDEALIHPVPPARGLGTFDLGSVPASVTPPKTWRKAAWFATASSGAVVIGLLFAGSALVGGTEDTRASDTWPGLEAGPPLITGELPGGGMPLSTKPSTSGTDTGRQNTGKPGTGTPSGDGRTAGNEDTTTNGRTGGAPGGTPGTEPGGTSGTGPDGPTGSTASTTQPPRKPPVQPAAYNPDRVQYFTSPTNQPERLYRQSQQFLDTVTEDPAAAHAMTTGELADEGASGLRRKYADVAYFEVKQVDVHQYDGDGVTVCTVKTVHNDGSSTTEQRTLTFGDQGKVSDDGK